MRHMRSAAGPASLHVGHPPQVLVSGPQPLPRVRHPSFGRRQPQPLGERTQRVGCRLETAARRPQPEPLLHDAGQSSDRCPVGGAARPYETERRSPTAPAAPQPLAHSNQVHKLRGLPSVRER
eukprot:ctg_12.g10